MSSTRTQALQPQAVVDTARFDEISLTLCNLTEIVKLAAFAAEARRTLAEIQDLARLVPVFQTTLKEEISNPNSWAELVDNTADVLDYVARQLKQVNGDFIENFHDLAHARTALPEAEKMGGRI